MSGNAKGYETAFDAVKLLEAELKLTARSIASVIALLTDGNTVPFIARYRKEATGGLDEVQIRSIEERHAYFTDLENRRQTILGTIDDQGKLTDDLRARIVACTSKTVLEDLYLPYKPKRRTRAAIARERGLQALADRVLEQPDTGDPLSEAEAFVNAELDVPDSTAALAGARDVVAEAMAENAEVRSLVRRAFVRQGMLVSEVVPDQREAVTKFEQYYDFREPVQSIPSHRYLAIRRGESENVLRVRIELTVEPLLSAIEQIMGLNERSPFAGPMREAIADGYKRLVAPSIDSDVRVELKMRSDDAAVEVFADNMRDLLLAPPLGEKPVLGVDPGIRTGCKCVVLDATGKLLEHFTIYPARGACERESARQAILAALARHGSQVIGVGNGTAGRETEALVRETLKSVGITDVAVLPVNESGASVYSASDIAREEFPELDVSVRGAVSIARRLQDPLAELVKIDPKAIGVGQYQHDVYQPLLARKLDDVVESCVNRVGVELNTASSPLLARVAGLRPSVAKNIIAYRDANGAFNGRKALLKVTGLGPRAFEQAAGFLRVRGGDHPLDASAVHPERYPLVERMALDLGVKLHELMGDTALVERIDVHRYVGDDVGEPTLRDIVDELKKPGRDPRKAFELPAFREDVTEIGDLKAGMELEGVVTNVTVFGAFVDVGVHQDGLVHISELADRFVKDPREVVAVGDRIKVRVLDVDLARKRIGLSARKESAPRSDAQARPTAASSPEPGRGSAKAGKAAKRSSSKKTQGGGDGFSNNPFAALKRR